MTPDQQNSRRISVLKVFSVMKEKGQRSAAGAVVLLVLPQVHFLLEAVVAESAAVGPVVSVLSAVCDEVGALAECFAAYLANMRLLPCKRPIGQG